MEHVLAINPGATSTKIALFQGETLCFKETVEHKEEDLAHFATVFSQHGYRLKLIVDMLEQNGFSLEQLQAVVARGGLLKPLLGGTYAVNEAMLADLQQAQRGEHASNLGAAMAQDLAEKLGIPAYIVDPVSVDELEPVARISGLAELPRVSLSHALNSKAVGRKVASLLGKEYGEVRLIVAHLGTGVSVSAQRYGRTVDVNNAMDEGPFSPDRCGTLPGNQLVRLCYSGRYSEAEMRAKVTSQGGMYSYLGTKDVREAQKMAEAGDAQAKLVLEAMPYQVAKDIGAMAAVLEGQVDAIALTGGIAYAEAIVADIRRRVEFIAPVYVVPGEEELESLALGALRVLRGEEEARRYE